MFKKTYNFFGLQKKNQKLRKLGWYQQSIYTESMEYITKVEER